MTHCLVGSPTTVADALTGGASIYGKQAGRPAAYAYAAARG